jgi:hypothetical protein
MPLMSAYLHESLAKAKISVGEKVRCSMTIPKACIGLCLCLTFSISLSSQESGRTQADNKSCRDFVGTFYTWYFPIASRNNRVPASDFALKERAYVFSSELLWRLREESEVQKRAGSDIVDLDADPFFSSDGPGKGFVLEKITIKDDRCWAELHTVWAGKEDATPDVTPELAFEDGRWLFVNFYYPSPSNPKALNLLSELKAIRESWKAYGLVKDQKR